MSKLKILFGIREILGMQIKVRFLRDDWPILADLISLLKCEDGAKLS